MTAHAVRAKDVTTLLLPATLLAVALGAMAFQLAPSLPDPFRPTAIVAPATVTLPPGSLTYRPEGHFLQDNVPIDGPRVTTTIAAPLVIMRHQVSVEDYARCVADGVCAATAEAGLDGYPVTGVSYQDAIAYAGWLSAQTGQVWTLPTDAEWAYAAAERYVDEAASVEDVGNPALRWLAEYREEAARSGTADPLPHPQGHFGANSNGLMDLSGNVWEWTDTCHRRIHVDAAGTILSEQPACAIRVIEGKHRASTSYFIRDPKSGGCSVGLPPDNLGFRLVRRPAWYEQMLHRIGL